MADDVPSPPPEAPADAGRRRLLARAAIGGCACVGAATLLGPAGVALGPLFQGDDGPKDGLPVALGPVSAFKVGAPPVRVVLRADERDAWSTRKNAPIGSALVQRTAENVGRNVGFTVLSGVCPHLGCAVDYRDDLSRFHCPCHGSSFETSGARVETTEGGKPNPSPRDLDPLDYDVVNDRLVVTWVRYATATAERKKVGA
ncbi:MAG: Rieske 2Fe-2S domain-containing protein [Myxococcales bacterium]|nr:Rieske 2Fe-2S domain-containing protein [Myxococcales bacterium]MCB9733556.1 Rieske 2Fe-2S domain-containing protein [Deltaproteobacteria bacterium]